jgi:hypothetical protein
MLLRLNTFMALRRYDRALGRVPLDPGTSVLEALQWLCHAQDATGTGGFSRAYSLIDGWDLAYPETTGYIIPTLLRFDSQFSQLGLKARAIRAGEWLCEVQLESGALCRKQYYAGNTAPSIFNTGMGLHGWISLAEETGDERFLQSANRAAAFIGTQQEKDGSWIRNSFNGLPHTYYTMVDWALLRCFQLTKEQRYRHAAIRHLDWTLRHQRPNGWFNHCGFTSEETATTHTISYTTQGLAESGRLLGEERYIQAAKKNAGRLLSHFQQHSTLAGLFNGEWEPLVEWECLTGNAQTLSVWSLMGEIYGEGFWQDQALALSARLMESQKTQTRVEGISGGIPGSSPINGDYDPFCFPNHAAKFFVDALSASRLVEGARRDIGAVAV